MNINLENKYKLTKTISRIIKFKVYIINNTNKFLFLFKIFFYFFFFFELKIENLTEEDNMRIPLLFVDVNLGPDKTQRIIVYEGDTAKALARKFALEYSK
jgi:hypothetical protein